MQNVSQIVVYINVMRLLQRSNYEHVRVFDRMSLVSG